MIDIASKKHMRLRGRVVETTRRAIKTTETKMKIGLLLLGGAILLCSCSSTRPYWTKPDIEQERFNADWDQCQKEKSAEQCMNAKGYVEVKR